MYIRGQIMALETFQVNESEAHKGHVCLVWVWSVEVLKRNASEASELGVLTERADDGRQAIASVARSHPVVHSLYLAHLHPANINSETHHGQSYQRFVSCFAPSLALLNSPGTLVKCDASIKAMLVDIDSKNNNEYIIEELDEEHILVKETRINELKARLNQVGIMSHAAWSALTVTDDEGTIEGTREFRL
jgi:TFIIH basal transcription factor complex TTD-A subunit